jgi:transcriptional regulator NrdR family protein
MKCPECEGTDSKVLKTLIHEAGNEGLDFGELKKRKRRCLTCRTEFFSYEVTESVFRKMRIPKRRPLKTNLDLRPSHV